MLSLEGTSMDKIHREYLINLLEETIEDYDDRIRSLNDLGEQWWPQNKWAEHDLGLEREVFANILQEIKEDRE